MAAKLWKIDVAHSSVSFAVRHMVIARVRGRFKRFGGELWLDDQDAAAARVEARIDAASIDTDEQRRDAHLRSPDFLDAARYPEISFRSTGVDPDVGRVLRVTGDLFMHGVTRPVVLAVRAEGQGRDPWGKQRAAFSARTAVDRHDFGLRWNQTLESSGLLVADRIDLELEIEAVAAPAPA
jgi:polyisoprenoid-binding protein YceI